MPFSTECNYVGKWKRVASLDYKDVFFFHLMSWKSKPNAIKISSECDKQKMKKISLLWDDIVIVINHIIYIPHFRMDTFWDVYNEIDNLFTWTTEYENWKHRFATKWFEWRPIRLLREVFRNFNRIVM